MWKMRLCVALICMWNDESHLINLKCGDFFFSQPNKFVFDRYVDGNGWLLDIYTCYKCFIWIPSFGSFFFHSFSEKGHRVYRYFDIIIFFILPVHFLPYALYFQYFSLVHYKLKTQFPEKRQIFIFHLWSYGKMRNFYSHWSERTFGARAVMFNCGETFWEEMGDYCLDKTCGRVFILHV